MLCGQIFFACEEKAVPGREISWLLANSKQLVLAGFEPASFVVHAQPLPSLPPCGVALVLPRQGAALAQ